MIRLVSGAGDIKITKDGNVLLHEMVMYVIITYVSDILVMAIFLHKTFRGESKICW